MNTIEKIENITSFSAELDKIYLVRNKTEILVVTNKLIVLLSKNIENDLQEMNSTNGFCWVNTSSKGTSFLLNDYKLKEEPYLIKYVSEGGCIYCKLSGKGTKLNIHGDIIWQFGGNFFEFIIAKGSFFYRKRTDIITNINDRSGIELWNHYLPDQKYDWYTKSNYENGPDELHKGEISRIIGEYAGTLWIALNSGLLLGLESDSGKLVYELSHPNNHDQDGTPFGPAINTQLDEINGILFGLRNKCYWEIDLADPQSKYRLYDISESCNTWRISADMPVREWSWLGNNIYFGEIYDSPHDQNLNNVGVFNRIKKEVVSAMRIGEGGRRDVLPNIQKIQFESGRLYVLDGRKVLHILKEDQTLDEAYGM